MKNRLIEPKTLAAIKNLPLLARTVVDGFMTGYNQRLRRGSGMEFNQYKSYQPGDDLRQMDWKMFARSDRYYIKEAEIDTSISVRFIVDASASMAHREGVPPQEDLSKMDYARFLVAALAYLAYSQGDAIGLFVLQEGKLINLTPRHDTMHLQRFWHQLDKLQPGGKFPDQGDVQTLFSGKRVREMTLFVSDLYEQSEEISRLIYQLSAMRNEVLCFHLMGKNEVDFTYQGHLTFEDLETGRTLQVDTAQHRQLYLKRMQRFLQSVREEMQKKQITYQLFALHQPLDEALRLFLTNRLRL
jgi:uncharacterized protein (DUF58 family)